MLGDRGAIGLEQVHDACRAVEGLVRGFGDAIKEELKPGLPSALLPYFLQQPVVVGAMRLQIETEIEQRLAHDAGHAKEERDQQPSQPAITVQEGMDGLELHVDQASLDQWR